MGKGMPHHYSKKDVTKEKVWHLKVREALKPNTFSHNYITQIIASDNEQTTGTILFGLSVDSLTKQLQVDDEFCPTERLFDVATLSPKKPVPLQGLRAAGDCAA